VIGNDSRRMLMNPGRRPRPVLLVVCGWLAAVGSVQAEVRLTSIVLDGRDVVLDAPPSAPPATPSEGPPPEGGRRTIRVPAAVRSPVGRVSGTLTIDYAGPAAREPTGPVATEADSPPPMARATRLRHRLDGIDDDWRDTPAHVRVFVQFLDASRRVLDTTEYHLEGESPGWRAEPELSDFHAHRFVSTAPARTAFVTAHFLSHGGAEVVGRIGIDRVVLTVTSPDGSPVEHPFPLTVGDAPPHPLDAPTAWTRRGGRSAMAQMRQRPGPPPRPILVLLDDDPANYGNWSMVSGAAVKAGDRVELSWESAHSLGVGGAARADYADLEPGLHLFRVGAFGPGGEPTEDRALLALDVFVPWHLRPETWLAGLAVGLAGAVAGGRTLSLRRMQRRLDAAERAHALERERTRIARDLHDEVGSALTEIAMQHYWVHQDMAASAPPATLDRLERARQSAVDLVRNVDAIVWAVNPANDTLDRFVPYLTHSVEQFLEAAGVAARIDVPDRPPALALDGAVRHALFLVVREAVNNAVRHGHPDTVRLAITITDAETPRSPPAKTPRSPPAKTPRSPPAKTLSILIADDGGGLPADLVGGAEDRAHASDAAAGSRSGLTNMRRRVEELGGRFTIASEPGAGTIISVAVPIPAHAAVS